MFTINLHNLIFHAHHGLHHEEKVLGNSYEVNLSLSFAGNNRIDSLEQSIDYTLVYQTIRQRMAIPTPLLETLAQDIAHQVHALDSRIASITVSVEKKNPPITSMQGRVSVSYQKDFL
jgi:7,8-dihydroneopterin aldolase/epimerase/oxygenase